jgi:hypothetical protein
MWAGHFFSIVELFAEVRVAGGALDGALRAHSHSTLAAVCRTEPEPNGSAAGVDGAAQRMLLCVHGTASVHVCMLAGRRIQSVAGVRCCVINVTCLWY